MKREFKYIIIEEAEPDVYDVYTRKHGDMLGEIRYFAKWREYEFYPASDTQWSWDCLRDLSGFINELNELKRTVNTCGLGL